MGKSNVYNFLALTIYIALVVGIFPVYVVKNRSKNSQQAITNRYTKLVPYIHVINIHIALLLATRESNPITESDIYNFNTLANLMILAGSGIGVMGALFCYYITIVSKTAIRDLINSLDDIDKTLSKSGYQRQYKFGFLINFIVSASGLIFMCCNIGMEVWNVPRENMEIIPAPLLFLHVFSFAVMHFTESQFVMFSLMIYCRFSAINDLLNRINGNLIAKERRRMARGSESQGIFVTGRGAVLEKKQIEKEHRIFIACTICHDKLCDMCDVLRKLYGIPILCACCIQLAMSTFSFCYYYYNLQIFCMQLAHRKITFTALGLFPIDASFIFTFVGASTTYIILLYQFEYTKITC